MRFFAVAAAALALTTPMVNALGFVFTSPSAGSVHANAQNIDIAWYINQADMTSLPSGTTTDTLATFVLQDLRAGVNTGQPIGQPIATARIGALSASGPLPSVAPGTAYSLRVQVGGTYVYTPQFQITSGGDGERPVATGTAPAPRPTSTTNSSASPTPSSASEAKKNGALSNNLAMGAVAGPVIAAAAVIFL